MATKIDHFSGFFKSFFTYSEVRSQIGEDPEEWLKTAEKGGSVAKDVFYFLKRSVSFVSPGLSLISPLSGGLLQSIARIIVHPAGSVIGRNLFRRDPSSGEVFD